MVNHQSFRALAHSLQIVAALLLVTLHTSCGSGNSDAGPLPGSTVRQSYSVASLSGQYAVSVGDIGSLYLDGKGNIDSSRSIMIGQFFTPQPPVTATGNYTVENNGRGFLSISYSSDIVGPVTRVLRFMILKDGSAVFTELDATPFQLFFANARFGNQTVQRPLSGRIRKQDSSAFNNSAIAGTYVYGACSDTSGSFTMDSAGNINGFDELTARPFTYSGGAAIDSSTGLLNYSDNSLQTETGGLFIVSSSEILFGSSPSALPCDFASKQTPGIALADLLGSYVLFDRVEAPPLSNLGNSPVPVVARAALITADGKGSLTGNEDLISSLNSVSTQSNQAITGSITLNAGEGTLGFDASAPAHFPFFVDLYAANSGSIYFVSPVQSNVLRTTSSGTLVAQESHAYSDSSLSGDYAVQMDGYDRTMLAKLTFDGTGHVTGSEDINIQGLFITNGVSLEGSYTIGSNGRGTMSLSSFFGTANYVMYLTSPSQFSVIGLDVVPMSGIGQQ